jgi:hypothetical protein
MNPQNASLDERGEAIGLFTDMLTSGALQPDGSLSEVAAALYDRWKDDEYAQRNMDGVLRLWRTRLYRAITTSLNSDGDESEPDEGGEAIARFTSMLRGMDLKPDGSLSERATALYDLWKDDEYVRRNMDGVLRLWKTLRSRSRG